MNNTTYTVDEFAKLVEQGKISEFDEIMVTYVDTNGKGISTPISWDPAEIRQHTDLKVLVLE